MTLSDKNILIISPEPWDHIFVSKHHYAIHLAKRNNKVHFLNPPSNKWRVLMTDSEKVWSVDYARFPRGLRFYPSSLQKYFIKKKFDKLQKLSGVKFDIVWSFDNSVFFDFSVLPSDVLKISHIVDLNQDFQIEKAARTADYCFCTTELIREKLRQFNKRVFKISHGFNTNTKHNVLVTMPGKTSIKAVYAGNLAMPYIDWVVINRTVKENSEIDFIFIGPNKDVLGLDGKQNDAKRGVYNSKNSFFVGRVEPCELFQFLSAADILLVTYQEKHHSDQANPHKMMEYLGSGKMIVATYTFEFEQLANNGFFLMSQKSNNDSFLKLFRKATSELEYWNSEEKRHVRKSFAMANSYENQIERIEEILKAPIN